MTIPDYGRARSAPLRRYLWIAVKMVLMLILVSGLAHAAWWWAVLRPYWRLQEMAMTQNASPSEFRAAAHAAIRFPGTDPHDAYILLLDYGDTSSVPVLIRSLRWQPHTPPGGAMTCTKAHCLEALRKLTGRDPGKNYEDWAPLLNTSPTSQPF